MGRGPSEDNNVSKRTWLLHAFEHGRYNGLGMDALVISYSGTQTILWLGHGCSGYRISSMDDIIGSACMLSLLDAHEMDDMMAWA